MSIQAAFKQLSASIDITGRTEEWLARAENVRLLRSYHDGDHQIALTDDMRKRLRLPKTTTQFTANYIPLIVKTVSGRLHVNTVEADTPDGTDWLVAVLNANKFDLLQTSTHDAAILDGDTFVMVGYDPNADLPYITHELAFDGDSGIIPVYYADTTSEMAAAIKIWTEYLETRDDGRIVLKSRTRINMYFPDRIEKYYSAGSDLQPFVDRAAGETTHVLPWTARDGAPLGIPIVHFANRRRGNFGISECAPAIPLQDVLNRVLYTLVASAESMGFPNRVAIGWNPTETTTSSGVADSSPIAPGDWLVAAPNGLMPGQTVDIRTMEPGNISQLISLAQFIVREIGTVSSTPAPEIFLSDSISGEAFKTRESSLITKAVAFQSDAGSRWEAVMRLAADVQAAYGVKPPPVISRFYARWREVDIRSNKDIVTHAVMAMQTGAFSKRAFLRAVAPVFELDEPEIANILKELEQEGPSPLAAINPQNGSYVNLRTTDEALEPDEIDPQASV